MSTGRVSMRNRPLPEIPRSQSRPDDYARPAPSGRTTEYRCPRHSLHAYVPVDTAGRTRYQIRGRYNGDWRTYTILPDASSPPHDRESVAMTISGIKQRCFERRQLFVKPCPIGLGDEEKERFCVLMEYSDDGVVAGGWRDLAAELMNLDDMDITMIGNFCRDTGVPVLELVLEHWNLLYIQGSQRCLRSPGKSELVRALTEMGRRDILARMGWGRQGSDV